MVSSILTKFICDPSEDTVSRRNEVISTSQAQNLKQAIEFASRINFPLNQFLTIQWSCADPGGNPLERFKRFFDRAREWLRRRGVALAYVYVHEHGDVKKVHSH